MSLVRIAAINESAISLGELCLLLPEGGFADAAALGAFIRGDEALSKTVVVRDGHVTLAGTAWLTDECETQRDLTSARLALASRFADTLVARCPWISLVAVSGSTAYGGAKPQDDVDFYLVTRAGRMWTTLLFAMLQARRLRKAESGMPVFCFNRVTEDAACVRSFGEARDPLFAREALSLKVLRGGGFYRSLLRESSWMRGPFPGLYTLRTSEDVPEAESPTRRGGSWWSLANALTFLSLGTYLALAGLVRNARLERQGRHEARFRTVIARDLCAYESRKYDELGEAYRRAF